MKLIKIDNVEYNVYDSKITRSFQVLDGENAGRLMNGKMERDIIGTYYNYTWELEADNEEVINLNTLIEEGYLKGELKNLKTNKEYNLVKSKVIVSKNSDKKSYNYELKLYDVTP